MGQASALRKLFPELDPTVLLWLGQNRAEKAQRVSLCLPTVTPDSTAGSSELPARGGASVRCCWSCQWGAASTWPAANGPCEQSQCLLGKRSSWGWVAGVSREEAPCCAAGAAVGGAALRPPVAMVGAAGQQGWCLPEGKSSQGWLPHVAPWLAQYRAEKACRSPSAYLGAKSDFIAGWQAVYHSGDPHAVLPARGMERLKLLMAPNLLA